MFTLLLAPRAVAALARAADDQLRSLLVAAFFLGLAGSSFAIGAAFVVALDAARRQGTALGIYGLGTLGQSLAVFVGPVVAARFGWQAVFRGTSVLLLVWAVVVLRARAQPARRRAAGRRRRDGCACCGERRSRGCSARSTS